MSVPPPPPAAGGRCGSGARATQQGGAGGAGGARGAPSPRRVGRHGCGLGFSNQRPWRLLQPGGGGGAGREGEACVLGGAAGRARAGGPTAAPGNSEPRRLGPRGPPPGPTLEPHPQDLGVAPRQPRGCPGRRAVGQLRGRWHGGAAGRHGAGAELNLLGAGGKLARPPAPTLGPGSAGWGAGRALADSGRSSCCALAPRRVSLARRVRARALPGGGGVVEGAGSSPRTQRLSRRRRGCCSWIPRRRLRVSVLGSTERGRAGEEGGREGGAGAPPRRCPHPCPLFLFCIISWGGLQDTQALGGSHRRGAGPPRRRGARSWDAAASTWERAP